MTSGATAACNGMERAGAVTHSHGACCMRARQAVQRTAAAEKFGRHADLLRPLAGEEHCHVTLGLRRR